MKHLILFDGTCALCTGSTRFIAQHDKKRQFTFIPLQSPKGQALLKKHHLPTNDFQSVIYLKNDQVFQKSTAALHVFKTLGGAWKLLFAFIIVPKFLRDAVYNWVAKNRHRFHFLIPKFGPPKNK